MSQPADEQPEQPDEPAVPFLEMTPDVAKQFIDYYKWVASVATFILTFSVTLGKGEATGWASFPLMLGWCFLAACVFLNIYVIKSLLIVEVFVTPYLKAAVNVQHWCFLLGFALTAIGLAVHLGFWKMCLAAALTLWCVWQMMQVAPAVSVLLRRFTLRWAERKRR